MEYTPFTTPAWYFRRHKTVCCLLAFTLLLLFVLFKYLFPHPNFMPDSYGYLGAAKYNNAIDFWPIGYSMFLRIQSAFSRNDVVLVAIQYFFLQASILYFLFGIAHLLQMNRRLLYVLAFALALNPVALLMSNYVVADALFTGLSMLWFCLLLQIRVRPELKLLVWQAVLMLLLFSIRYNALYYPVVALVVIAFARFNWRHRLAGVALMLLPLGLFVLKNRWEYKKLTGTAQFSPFGGYMLGGNALFMYSHLPKDKEPPPAKFTRLHQLVNRHMDSLRTAPRRPDSTMGVYYIWKGPLFMYTAETYLKDSTTPYFKRWASMAPLYQEYAAYLIQKHPLEYMRYFMLPNAGYYFAPPSEFLNTYNEGKDSVDRAVKDWFGYKNRALHARIQKNYITDYVAVVNTLFNILLFGCVLGWVLLKGYRISTKIFNQAVVLTLLLIAGNMLFSVTLAPIVFRYQLLFFVLTVTFGCLLVQQLLYMGRLEAAREKEAPKWQTTAQVTN